MFLFSAQSGNESLKSTNILIVCANNVINNLGLNIENTNNNLFIVRKAAHFYEYFLLGACISIICLNFKFYLTLPLCLIVAFLDEFHQTFIEGRSGQLSDVLLDYFAAFVSIIIIYTIYKKLLNCSFLCCKN